MAGPDDIPIAPPAGESPASAKDRLVWLEGGEERPFEDVGSSQRPWLEVSVEWNAPFDGEKLPPEEPEDEDDLVWL